jgi:Ca2+/H+ antiporter, TMEM165/GDT1 family
LDVGRVKSNGWPSAPAIAPETSLHSALILQESIELLDAFTQSLLLITSAELGDKSFLITMILALRHPRRWVFIGTTLALAIMTVLSVVVGRVFTVVDLNYLRYAESILFLFFGLKLLYRGWKMSPHDTGGELAEAEAEVEKADRKLGNPSPMKMVLEAFTLIFIAEWGDRTQFATIALAAANNPVGVSIGAILGHTICAAIAVIAGRSIAARISERSIMLIGGGLFVIFGILALFQH